MTLTVQQYSGTVDNANAYGDVAGMRAYFAVRGVDLTSSSDDLLSQKLVLATDFLDSRYSFIGDQLRGEQGTACPRYLTGGARAHVMRNINLLGPAYLLTPRQWQVLVDQCYQLAQRALSKPLLPDPTHDVSGLQVIETKTVAGPVETSKKYGAAPGGAVPMYPAVDMALRNAGLLASSNSGSIVRG